MISEEQSAETWTATLVHLWHERIWGPLCGRTRCQQLSALLDDAALAGRTVHRDLERIVQIIIGRRLSRFVMGDHANRQSLTDFFKRGAIQASRLRPHMQPGDAVLEYGGGIGRIGHAIAPHVQRLVSVDANPLMKVYGPVLNPGIDFRNREELPESEKFDGAYSIAVFFHLPLAEQRRALEYVHRRLKPGGWFLVDIKLGAETSNLDAEYGDVRPTALEDFRALYDPIFTARRIPLYNAGFLLRRKEEDAPPPIPIDGQYAVNEASVVADVLENEVVVVNLDNGSYYILQGSASLIWQMLASGHTVAGIVANLIQRYSSEGPMVETSITDFVGQLTAEALLIGASGNHQPAVSFTIDQWPADDKPFAAPVMFRYTDMQALIQMDPIREYRRHRMARPACTSPATGVMTVPQRLDDYFDSAVTLFDAAVARTGAGPDRNLVIGGHTARLRFAGPAVASRVLPALRHLPRHETPAAPLAIHLWDLKSTGVVLPPPPWEAVEYHERGNARAFSDERFSLSFERRTDVFSAVDNERGLAIYWTRDADALPNFTTAAPMQRLLQGWLRARGLFVLHAAAIGRADAGLLLAGRSGSGKSTTALLALESDWLYAGDDYALVQDEPSAHVHSLYSSAKLNADALDRLPALRTSVSNPEHLHKEKALLFLDIGAPDKLARGFPLRAIVLPYVARQRDSVVTPASPLAAYRAIGPDTAFTMLGGDARGVLRTIRNLVHQLPCYTLALGTDPVGVDAALHDVLGARVMA